MLSLKLVCSTQKKGEDESKDRKLVDVCERNIRRSAVSLFSSSFRKRGDKDPIGSTLFQD